MENIVSTRNRCISIKTASTNEEPHFCTTRKKVFKNRKMAKITHFLWWNISDNMCRM